MTETKDLIIYSEVEAGVIKDNFDVLLAEVKKRVDPYRNRVVTKENEKTAKDDVAYLNKTIEQIESRRKHVKKDLMKPYQDFEDRVKQVVREIEGPKQEIKQQLDDFEQRRVQEKWADIQALKGKLLEGHNLQEYILHCEFVDNPKWGNMGYTMKQIEKELSDIIRKIELDVHTINKNSVYSGQLHGVYRCTGDISQVLSKQEEYEARYRKEEELAKSTEDVLEDVVVEEEESATYAFSVTATMMQFRALKRFCEESGIGIRRIK